MLYLVQTVQHHFVPTRQLQQPPVNQLALHLIYRQPCPTLDQATHHPTLYLRLQEMPKPRSQPRLQRLRLAKQRRLRPLSLEK